VARATAAAQRQQVAAAPAAPPAPREAPAGGGFMVQLGAPGSEAEARTTFAALQRRYGQALAGETPVIRRADVGGRTVYRLRIGPYSRSDAAEKCQAIQAAGGQCFISGS
jgi:cell division protein FtsN